MKSLILFATVFSFTFNCLAGDTVLLVSPLVRLEQRDLPLELDKNYKSFSNYYLESVPKEKNVENLLNEFESAQKYYLVKSFELARQYYENVVAYSDVDEWKDVHRKIIFLSYIRLSELNKQNEQDLILQALRFSLETDPSQFELSKETLKKITEAKKSFLKETISWQVTPFKKEFTYILINGHTIDLKKIETIKIPSGKFRVTFLSDVYKPQTYQVSSQQIPLLVPTRIPFVSGSCEKPFINNEGEAPTDLAAYFSKDCIKQQVGNKWILSSNSKNPNFIPAVDSAGGEFTSSYHNDEPIYKKSWFLIAVGVVATTAAIYAFSKDEKKPTHETVNGF
jgi:hypothetical protein